MAKPTSLRSIPDFCCPCYPNDGSHAPSPYSRGHHLFLGANHRCAFGAQWESTTQNAKLIRASIVCKVFTPRVDKPAPVNETKVGVGAGVGVASGAKLMTYPTRFRVSVRFQVPSGTAAEVENVPDPTHARPHSPKLSSKPRSSHC